MSIISELRNALSANKEGKDITREAGAGMWANYVRATCYLNTVRTPEDLNRVHDEVVSELNTLRDLSKDEKNSLRSAKSVVSKAISRGVDVWQREPSGAILVDDNGNPLPKGKSELQEAKTDFERLVASLDAFEKKFQSETRESLTADELDVLKGRLLAIGAAVGEEWAQYQ
jgi:hypothetical protein